MRRLANGDSTPGNDPAVDRRRLNTDRRAAANRKHAVRIDSMSADAMTQTPMYQVYRSVAPHPEQWLRLVEKMRDLLRQDLDFTDEVAQLTMPSLVVAGDSDIFPVQISAC
jgi:pimeloyl-ACP methyl ester carboxylesterase